MPALLRIALAAALAVSPLPAAAAAPPKPREATDPAAIPDDDAAVVAMAKPAWESGDWAEVRRLLEPLASARDRLTEARLRETALLYLADATMSDATLDPTARRRLAGTHIQRLLDEDPTWRMPPDIYSPELYNLFLEIQEERTRTIDTNCQAELTACRSDVRTDAERYAELEAKHTDLQKKYAVQEIETRDRVARSRFLAAIPFGVGHFYNGAGSRSRTDRALGASFLAAELAIGGVGLGLLLYRVIGDGCRRNRGFQRGSLRCSQDPSELDAIVRRRKAEEVMGWFFFGSVALDIVLAQVRFQPTEIVRVDRVQRGELEAGEPAAPAEVPRKRRKPGPRAKVRPTGAIIPRGVGLGVSVRF